MHSPPSSIGELDNNIRKLTRIYVDSTPETQYMQSDNKLIVDYDL
jgi:hypothetical protein